MCVSYIWHIWNMCTIFVTYVKCVYHICDIYEICVPYVWHVYQMLVPYLWLKLICLPYLWDILNVCTIFVTYMMCLCHLFERIKTGWIDWIRYSRLPAILHHLGHSFPVLGKKFWTSQSTQSVALKLMNYSKLVELYECSFSGFLSFIY